MSLARTILPALCAFALLAAPAVAVDPTGPPDADDPMVAFEAAHDATETDAQRVALIKDFLAEHPHHPDAIMLLDYGAGLMSVTGEGADAAVAMVRAHRALLEDPAHQAKVDGILMDLFGDPGYREDLKVLVAELYDPAGMSYVDHLDVIRAYVGAEAWDEVDAHATAAMPLATPAAFRAAYPDRGFSDEYIEGAGRNRIGLLKTYTGWAAANRGDRAAAFADFAAAEPLVRETFFGLPDNKLFRYWGQTLVDDGRLDEGLKKLSLAAVFGHDDEADHLARAAFDARYKVGDFDDYLWNLRLKNAPDMPGFVAYNYHDVKVSWEDVRGEKATLLAFWFPT